MSSDIVERPTILPMRRKLREVGGGRRVRIARAVADHRQRFFRQRGKHQFTLLAIGQHFAGFGVDDFRVEVVFKDMKVFTLKTVCGNTRSDDLRKPINLASRRTPRVCRSRPASVRVDVTVDVAALKPPSADDLRVFARNFEVPICRAVQVRLSDGSDLLVSVDMPLMAKQSREVLKR